MSNSVRPHRRQPSRLPRPWDSPGKNTGVGCHFLLQCVKVTSESEVAQSCQTLRDPMDRSLPGSSIHGVFQARVLEWGAIPTPGPSNSTLIPFQEKRRPLTSSNLYKNHYRNFVRCSQNLERIYLLINRRSDKLRQSHTRKCSSAQRRTSN